MAETTIEVRNPSGLHARPLATFVKAAGAFAADVQVTNLTRNPDKSASAKSMLMLLQLGVTRGHTVRITAQGEDADAAVDALRELVVSGLGEPLTEPEP
jgi:phosphotransferase system HPr (HPr) family protein